MRTSSERWGTHSSSSHRALSPPSRSALRLVDGVRAVQVLCEPHLGQCQGLFVERHALVEQLALHLGHADVEPAVHHVTHQRQGGDAQPRLRRQQVRARGQLCGFARAEQAQIPGQVDAGVKVRVHGRHVLQRANAGRDVGLVRGRRHTLQQTLLFEAAQRLRQIEVLGQRLLDQGVQLRVLPAPPPGLQVGGREWGQAGPCSPSLWLSRWGRSRFLLQPAGWQGLIQRRAWGRHAPVQQSRKGETGQDSNFPDTHGGQT